MGFYKNTIAAALVSAATVAAHGHVSEVIINGVSYAGFDPTSAPYQANPPVVIGWAAEQPDNGFVDPAAFASGDIICHKAAVPAKGHAQVAAGDSVSLVWNTWPESHHGPMIDYLAKCDGACETVDKTALEFFKIDAVGIVDGSSAPGIWGSDILIKNSNTWTVQIPTDLAPGNYVLRHETIALHSAGQANGAQSYPQCFNLEVTGSGSLAPAGVKGTELYKADDAGIAFNIYTAPIDYPIPGPALIAGAAASVEQVVPKATATSSATQGSGAGATVAPTAPAATSAPAVTSQAPAPAPTTLVTSARPASSSAVAAPAPTAPTTGGSSSVASLYAQCGGNGFTGPTACAEGSTCKKQNDYYSQCLA